MSQEPNYTERRGLDGRMFAKTRPMNCPWCGDLFYVYQADDNPQEPYVNPEPHLTGPQCKEEAHGMRHVCDKPACWDQEQLHQVGRSPLYTRACEEKFNSHAVEPVKLTKGSGLKRVAS